MHEERVEQGGVVKVLEVDSGYVRTDKGWLPILHPSTGTTMWEAVGGGALRQPQRKTAGRKLGGVASTLEEAQAQILWLLRERAELRKRCGLPAAVGPGGGPLQAKPEMTIDEFLDAAL